MAVNHDVVGSSPADSAKSGDPPPKQGDENKKTAPGSFRELFWYQGLSVMFNVDFSFYSSFSAHERR